MYIGPRFALVVRGRADLVLERVGHREERRVASLGRRGTLCSALISLSLYISLSIYLYIYIYVCTYIYIYMIMCIYIYIYIYIDRGTFWEPGGATGRELSTYHTLASHSISYASMRGLSCWYLGFRLYHSRSLFQVVRLSYLNLGASETGRSAGSRA